MFYDALVHPDTIALAARAQKVAVGKRCGKHSTAQQFINKRLVDAAQRHAVVVRLKGGDPMLFGRAQEEIAALEAAGIACEVVPGITAALAAAAAAQARRSRSAAARAASRSPRRAWATSERRRARGRDGLAAADAGAIYMGVGEAARIAADADRGGQAAGPSGGDRRKRVAAGAAHPLHHARAICRSFADASIARSRADPAWPAVPRALRSKHARSASYVTERCAASGLTSHARAKKPPHSGFSLAHIYTRKLFTVISI